MALLLKATTRKKETRGGMNALRSVFKVPAVVYGHGHENHSISLDYRDFDKLYAQAGTSSLISLEIDGAKNAIPVLVSEIQRNPVTDRVIHVDLHQISMDEKLRTEIQLIFTGESPAVKNLGANLIINKDKLTIECLPKDLVSSIELDLSGLTELDASIHIRDMKIPAGITVIDNADESVVSVLAPREEVVEEQTATVEPEVIGKGTEATEEGEGEQATTAATEKKPSGKE